MSVKICIVGCGAIGSIFGAHLAHLEDVEVHAYDVWRDHTRAINERGLRISGAADFTAHLHATSDPSEIPQCDFGIVATKSTHTRSAIEQTAHVFLAHSAVCSVQNGVGNEEIIAQHVGSVIRGTTFPAGHVVEPGHAAFDINGDTWIGPFEPTNTPYARRATRGNPQPVWLARDSSRRCSRSAMDQVDFQRFNKSRRSAYSAAPRRRRTFSSDQRSL